MTPGGFASPWEHLRLLSDPDRNRALITLLERHAPGATVAEVGCGTGLLSLVAAKLGARKVWAIEPTEMAEVAEQVVRDNGLGGVIEVLPSRIEDLEPRPVDLAFSELLNADPFYEGVVSAMAAARRWVGPPGRLAPRRLRVYAAVVAAPDSAREARLAGAEVRGLGERFGLRLDGLLEALAIDESYRYFSADDEVVSSSALVWDVALGEDDEPPDEVVVEVTPTRPGPAAGALVWFESELDDGLVLTNAPGRADHWGRLVCAWGEERGLRTDTPVRLRVTLDDDEVDVAWGDP
ncbi:MAG: 50S ribosomal protein L11 methyltransferase [Myxococcota bacterium]